MSIWALILYIYVGLNLAYAPFALSQKKEFKFEHPAASAFVFIVLNALLGFVIYKLYAVSDYEGALTAAVILAVVRVGVLLSQLYGCARGSLRYTAGSFWADCFVAGVSFAAISTLAFF